MLEFTERYASEIIAALIILGLMYLGIRFALQFLYPKWSKSVSITDAAMLIAGIYFLMCPIVILAILEAFVHHQTDRVGLVYISGMLFVLVASKSQLEKVTPPRWSRSKWRAERLEIKLGREYNLPDFKSIEKSFGQAAKTLGDLKELGQDLRGEVDRLRKENEGLKKSNQILGEMSEEQRQKVFEIAAREFGRGKWKDRFINWGVSLVIGFTTGYYFFYLTFLGER